MVALNFLPMQTETLATPLHIIGLELRTTNERAFQDIPPFWGRFFQEGVDKKISNKLGEEIYAVYTNFENEGVNNEGEYSMVVGYAVKEGETVPEGLVEVTIPAAEYAVFSLEKGQMHQVGNKWMEIWELSKNDPSFNQKRSYTADFERYGAIGEVDILVGLKKG